MMLKPKNTNDRIKTGIPSQNSHVDPAVRLIEATMRKATPRKNETSIYITSLFLMLLDFLTGAGDDADFRKFRLTIVNSISK
jgi:hypothetical protein